MRISFDRLKTLTSRYVPIPEQDRSNYRLDKLERDFPEGITLDGSSISQDTIDNLLGVISKFSEEIIIEEFGVDGAESLWLYAGEEDSFGKLANIVGRKTGIDPKLLAQSKKEAWDFYFSKDLSSVLRGVELKINTKRIFETLLKPGLPELLKQFVEPGITLSEGRIADYSLIIVESEEKRLSGHVKVCPERKAGRETYCEVYIDSPIGICLTYKNEPNAIVSFSNKGSDTLLIRQIQGMKIVKLQKIEKKDEVIKESRSRGLVVLNWKDLLVRIAEIVAMESGYDKVGIMSAYNNSWIRHGLRIPEDRGLKIYDHNARKLGYVQHGDRNWYRNLCV